MRGRHSPVLAFALGCVFSACTTDSVGPKNLDQVSGAVGTVTQSGSVSLTSPLLVVGDTSSLTTDLRNRRGQKRLVISYVSRDPAIASVTTQGLVTVVSAGTTWIVVSASNGFKDSVVVSIPLPVPPVPAPAPTDPVAPAPTPVPPAPTDPVAPAPTDPVAPAPAPAPPAGVLFASSWNTATGNSQAAVTDGGAFNDYYSCSRSDVLSVVSGAALGWTRSPNILRVTEVGNGACGAVQRTQAVPVSTTHWGRMYFRNDETTQDNSMHNFSYRFVGSIQLIWFNRRATAQGFQLDVRMPAAYPFNTWRLQTSAGTNPLSPPLVHLRNGTWYRYEWQLEYVSATRVRFWPRVYTDAGVLLHDASNFYQLDAPTSGTATLASWYAAGNTFAVADLNLIRDIGVGNEGRAADTRPGQSWYIANFAMSTTGWLGQ